MTVKIPSLNWLRVFEAAARCESFARAGTHLNMSAAAVSQQVRALEDRLGASLFERHAHSVTLTEVGRAYLPSVQHALVTLESATDGLFGAVREQRLYVQSVLIFAHGMLARGLPEFSIKYPDISLTLGTANQMHEFAHGFSDMQIIFGNPQSFDAESDRLMGEWLYPIALPEIAATITSPLDMLKHCLIEVATHRAGWPCVFDHLEILPGVARYQYADSTIMAMALASEGAGVALARAPASNKAMEEAGLIPCLPEISVPGREAYHLVYPNQQALRPPAKKFREWLLDWIAANSEAGA